MNTQHLTNYGLVAVFGVSGEVVATFLDAEVTEHGYISRGHQIGSQVHTFDLPVVAPGGGTFTFYIHNLSPYFVNVRCRTTVTAEVDAMMGRRLIKLKQTSPHGPIVMSLAPHPG